MLAVGLAALAIPCPGRILADEPPPDEPLPAGMITVPAPAGPGGPAAMAGAPGRDGLETVAAVPAANGLEPISAVPRLDGEFPGPAPSFQWYFRTEGIALRREVTGSLHDTPFATLLLPIDPTLASFPANWQSTPVLTEDDLQRQFRGGPRFTIGHRLGDSPWEVECSYFWLATSSTAASTSDPNGHLFSPFTGFGSEVINFYSTQPAYTNLTYPNADLNVDQNTLVQVVETSKLATGELNLRWNLSMPYRCVSAVVLFGARYMNVREQFDYMSQSTIYAPPTAVSVDAHTNNELWGGQLGGIIQIGCFQKLWLDLEAKGALCENRVTREFGPVVVAGNHFPQTTLAQSGSAAIGDFDFALSWRPTAGLTARIGYEAMIVNGLALASQNFVADSASLEAGTANPPLNRNGTVLYHGPFAGVQLNW
jgi:hypothetical protein